jgi:ComF family protein
LRGVWVCNECQAKTKLFEDPRCDRCGRSREALYCHCELPIGLDFVRPAGPLQGWLRSAVHSFKYAGESARSPHLAGFLVPLMEGWNASIVLTAVPLHKNRLKERGYNQSELLTKHLAQLTGAQIWPHLIRVKDTPHQVGLPAEKRVANVAGAFEVARESPLVPTSVVLVDDVITTGATVSECAKVLAASGARSIGVIALARD